MLRRRARRQRDKDITRVLVDGRVIGSDGKTENAQHVLALDPFTPAVLKAPSRRSTRSAASTGRTTTITACCSAWSTAVAGLPGIDLHDVRHSYATSGQWRGVASDASFPSGVRTVPQGIRVRVPPTGDQGDRANPQLRTVITGQC